MWLSCKSIIGRPSLNRKFEICDFSSTPTASAFNDTSVVSKNFRREGGAMGLSLINGGSNGGLWGSELRKDQKITRLCTKLSYSITSLDTFRYGFPQAFAIMWGREICNLSKIRTFLKSLIRIPKAFNPIKSPSKC